MCMFCFSFLFQSNISPDVDQTRMHVSTRDISIQTDDDDEYNDGIQVHIEINMLLLLS